MTDPRQRRQLQQLNTIAHQAARLTGLLGEAYTAIGLTLPDGYPSGGSEPVSGGDIGNPTLGAVLERERTLESVEDRHSDEARTAALAARLVEILALEYGNDDQVLIDLGVDGVLQAMIDAEEPAGVIHIRRDLSDTEAAEIKDRWIAEHGSTANRPAGDA